MKSWYQTSSLALSAVIASFISGCAGDTGDTLQRLAYGAVQSTRQERCINNSAAAQSINCIQNVPYDEYQRQRSEVNSAR